MAFETQIVRQLFCNPADDSGILDQAVQKSWTEFSANERASHLPTESYDDFQGVKNLAAEPVWSWEAKQPIFSSPAWDAKNSQVIIATVDGKVSALDHEGEIKSSDYTQLLQTI